MSRKSSGTTFEPTGTISGPMSWSEPSIHVSGTPFDRFRGYFQNLSQKSCGIESLSVKVWPARCLAQVSLGVNNSKNGSKGQNNDQFWAHRAHNVPCVHTEPFSGSQSQKLVEISNFFDFFLWRILQKTPWCHRPGSVSKDTSDTVPRPRHHFSHSIYGSKPPNPEDNLVRRKF